MIPAVRSQADNVGDEYSKDAGLDTGFETPTRQEFGQEADINYILTRFGVQGMDRPIEYGQSIDYNLDLQTALTALADVKAAQFSVPTELKNKYPSWREILNAADTGEYQWDLQNLAEQKKAAEERAKVEADKATSTKGATP